MNEFNTLMEFYDDPCLGVFDNDEVKERINHLVLAQLSFIDLCRSEGMSDKEIKAFILSPQQFVKSVEKIVWSRP